jgi:hypothetical protein
MKQAQVPSQAVRFFDGAFCLSDASRASRSARSRSVFSRIARWFALVFCHGFVAIAPPRFLLEQRFSAGMIRTLTLSQGNISVLRQARLAIASVSSFGKS